MNDAETTTPTGRWGRFKGLVRQKLIQPFAESRDPVHEVALGASIGTFLGFTPTVGIQMYLVLMFWVLFRYVFRIRFNMIIAMTMVWTSNPLTMIPMYYAFLVTGQWMQELAGVGFLPISYTAFSAEVGRLGAAEELSALQWLYNALKVLIVEFGWPLVLGSLVYAIPGAIIAYPLTGIWLPRYRKFRAAAEGITYREWRARNVRRSD